MIEIHPLPFQEELSLIYSELEDLSMSVHPESELAEALDRVLAILDPFVGTVEWMPPFQMDKE